MGYSHAIMEVLNNQYKLGIEYYPKKNSDKPLKYFKDILDNLRVHHNSIKRKLEKVKEKILDYDLNYLLIDGENIFYGVNDSKAIRQELDRLRRLTNAGCVLLFCQKHSIERGGKFAFLHEIPGRFIIIDGADKTELDDIFLVMAERIIRKIKRYPSCSIGAGYPHNNCDSYGEYKINIYTNDNFGWA